MNLAHPAAVGQVVGNNARSRPKKSGFKKRSGAVAIPEGGITLKLRLNLFIRKKSVEIFLSLLICLTSIVSVLTSVDSIQQEGVPPRISFDLWWFIELFCVFFFTIELLINAYIAPHKARWISRPSTIIDIVAIAPFYVDVAASAINIKLSWLRMFRLFRVIRMMQYNAGITIIAEAFVASAPQMSALFLFSFIATILFASALYYIEGGERGANPKINNIPVAMYWCWTTLTTVGYGDITPVTGGGRALACLVMFVGSLVFALPITIISAKYLEMVQLNDQEEMKEKAQVRLFKALQHSPGLDADQVLAALLDLNQELDHDIDEHKMRKEVVFLFAKFDENEDGMLDREELVEMTEDIIQSMFSGCFLHESEEASLGQEGSKSARWTHRAERLLTSRQQKSLLHGSSRTSKPGFTVRGLGGQLHVESAGMLRSLGKQVASNKQLVKRVHSQLALNTQLQQQVDGMLRAIAEEGGFPEGCFKELLGGEGALEEWAMKGRGPLQDSSDVGGAVERTKSLKASGVRRSQTQGKGEGKAVVNKRERTVKKVGSKKGESKGKDSHMKGSTQLDNNADEEITQVTVDSLMSDRDGKGKSNVKVTFKY